MKKSKWKLSAMWIAIIGIVLTAFLTWLVASDFGSVKIMRCTIPAENGKDFSYTAWIPKTATDETKAPLVVNFPGRSSMGHQHDYWMVEMARRGYVVVNADWAANGESEIMSNPGYVKAIFDSALAFPFVDTENVTVSGCSAGNNGVITAGMLYSDVIDTYIVDVWPMVSVMDVWGTGAGLSRDLVFNELVVQASSDQYVDYIADVYANDPLLVQHMVMADFGLAEVVDGQYYGSVEQGNLKRLVTTKSIHHSAAIDKGTIVAIVEFLEKVAPTGYNLPSDNLTFGWLMLCHLLGYFSIIFFVVTMAVTLFKNVPYFNYIGNELPANKGLRGKKLIGNCALTFLIPFILFIPATWLVFNYTEFTNSFMQSRNLRGIVGWLLIVAIINVIIMVVKATSDKKKGLAPMTLADYGLAGEGETSLPWVKIWRALLLAVITISTTYAWLTFVERTTGLNYQFWNMFVMSEATPKRLLASVPYCIILVLVMIVSNIGMNTTRRLADDKNPSKALFLQIVLNIGLAVGPILLLLLIQYGGGFIAGSYPFPQFANPGVGGDISTGCLDFAFGFPLIMGFTSGMSTYLYKKTGNIWIGAFISGILGGIVGTVAATFIL